MRKSTRTAWFGAAAAGAALFLGLHFTGHEELAPAPQSAESNLFAFVRSMEGTQPDGNIQTQGDTLVVSPELVRMFDYYLAALGEKSLDAIRAEIERNIEVRLQGRAAEQAKGLLARYLDYKRELVNVEQDAQLAGSSADAIRGRIAAMQKTRSRYFTAREIDSLFALDDTVDLDAVARLEISQDKSLSDAEKRDKLAALDAALPQAVRDAREEPVKVIKLEESVVAMRTKGASDDEVYRMRAAALSPEAAARLAAVDREEESWKARIAAYRAQRAQIMSSSTGLAQEERVAQIEQLRQAQFTPDEQKRLAAYE